ncbi:DUF473 domain-containing protein [Methanosarcinales archaeon]|nr:MAG: DUF473 domain-containing protein [Methanosarcinales archaeon]
MDMRCIAITGISNEVLTDVMERGLRTIEIRSPHNFSAVLELGVGDTVFITSTTANDVIPGTKGILAIVVKKNVYFHRSLQQVGAYVEETEHLSAQLQLKARGYGVVRDVISNSIGEPVVVDVREVAYFDAF